MSFQGSGGGHNFSHGGGHHDTMHFTVQHNSYANHRRNSGHVTIHSSRHGAVHGRVNMAHFHHVFRAPHRYRIGVWHAPRGFRYRRFGIGEHIPALLLVPAFFLLDYYDYGLEEPDYGYVWVRDGDDAVLVDRYTGEVVEVEYDVFY
jgi:Ni/Co efflux regulator RcnB